MMGLAGLGRAFERVREEGGSIRSALAARKRRTLRRMHIVEKELMVSDIRGLWLQVDLGLC